MYYENPLEFHPHWPKCSKKCHSLRSTHTRHLSTIAFVYHRHTNTMHINLFNWMYSHWLESNLEKKFSIRLIRDKTVQLIGFSNSIVSSLNKWNGYETNERTREGETEREKKPLQNEVLCVQMCVYLRIINLKTFSSYFFPAVPVFFFAKFCYALFTIRPPCFPSRPSFSHYSDTHAHTFFSINWTLFVVSNFYTWLVFFSLFSGPIFSEYYKSKQHCKLLVHCTSIIAICWTWNISLNWIKKVTEASKFQRKQQNPNRSNEKKIMVWWPKCNSRFKRSTFFHWLKIARLFPSIW